MMRLFAILLLLFLSGLAGCLDTSPACFSVAWPGPGSEFTIHGTFTHGADDREYTYRIGESTTSLDGFGNQIDGIPIHRTTSGSILLLDPMRRQTVKHDHPAFDDDNYGIDKGQVVLAHQLMGACWTQDERLEASYGQPDVIQTFDIVTATSSRMVVENVRPDRGTPFIAGSEPSMRTMRFIYEESHFVPSTTLIFDEEGKEMARWTLVSEEAIAAAVVPPGRLAPIPNHATPWKPYPDFAGFDFGGFTFDEMLDHLKAEPGFAEFAEQHPDARIAEATWRHVTEPQSTSVEWTGILRDDSTEGWRFEWVKRCYQNESLVMLYGECEFLRSHGEGSLFPTTYGYRGAIEVEAATAPWLGSSVSAGRLVAIARNFTDGGPVVRIDWSAFPTGGPDIAYDFAGAPGARVHFGTIIGNVDYTAPGGPEGEGFTEDLESIWMYPSGWVLFDQVHNH